MNKVIGIGGVSNSGKSRFAEILKVNLPDKKVKIICQDDYIHPQYEIPQIKDHIDWESPESINFIAFKEAILNSKEIFDIVIAEGFLAFYDPRINLLYDNKIFIKISKETFLKRKRKDLRWGKEPEWYIKHIWQRFLKNGQPLADKKKLLIINGEVEFDVKKIIEIMQLA